jgi:hypothetical protein
LQLICNEALEGHGVSCAEAEVRARHACRKSGVVETVKPVKGGLR